MLPLDARPPADLILTNGRFYTLSVTRPWVEAIAVVGQWIVATGSSREVARWRGPKTQAVDLEGRFALPGFNDAHGHVQADLSMLEEASRWGITTIQDITPLGNVAQYKALEREGKLACRLNLRLPIGEAQAHRDDPTWAAPPDAFVRAIGVKGYVDGMMSKDTALFFEPYDHQPWNRGAFASDAQPPAKLRAHLGQALDYGLTPHIHAIGDRAVSLLLDWYEQEIGVRRLADHRMRVIHAQVVRPCDFERFGRLGLVAEVNPYHCVADMPWMEAKIGAGRCAGAYAFRSLADAGALVCFASDAPGPRPSTPYPMNPLLGIHAAVTRQTLDGTPEGGWYPEQRMTVEECLRAYTLHPAVASFEEGFKGSLEPGKLADIAVLSHDPLSIPSQELQHVQAVQTFVGGRLVRPSRPDDAASERTI